MDMALQKQAGKGLAVPAGIAYALGICLQFLDHRFLKDKVTETAVFVIAAVGLLFFHERAVHLREDENMPAVEEEKLSMDQMERKTVVERCMRKSVYKSQKSVSGHFYWRQSYFHDIYICGAG